MPSTHNRNKKWTCLQTDIWLQNTVTWFNVNFWKVINEVLIISQKSSTAAGCFPYLRAYIMNCRVRWRECLVPSPSSTPAAQPEHQLWRSCPRLPPRTPGWRRWWRSTSCPSWTSACGRSRRRRAGKHAAVSDEAQSSASYSSRII